VCDTHHDDIDQSDRGLLMGDERGVTLIELLVGMTLTLVITSLSLNLLGTAVGGHERAVARADTVAQVQEGVARLMRDLHQVTSFNFLSDQVVDVDIRQSPTSSTLVQVRYDCSQGAACRRYEAAPGQTLPPVGDPMVVPGVVLAEGVVDPRVFTANPDGFNPRWVGIRLELAIEGAEQPVVVTDGTSMPNVFG
jgi:hypothetical protein